jgi:hypothetical protein
MTTLVILILNVNDRTIYVKQCNNWDASMLKYVDINKAFERSIKHVKTMLNSILPDIHNIDFRAEEVKNKSLRLELREEIAKRRQRYRELYDEAESTIFLKLRLL